MKEQKRTSNHRKNKNQQNNRHPHENFINCFPAAISKLLHYKESVGESRGCKDVEENEEWSLLLLRFPFGHIESKFLDLVLVDEKCEAAPQIDDVQTDPVDELRSLEPSTLMDNRRAYQDECANVDERKKLHASDHSLIVEKSNSKHHKEEEGDGHWVDPFVVVWAQKLLHICVKRAAFLGPPVLNPLYSCIRHLLKALWRQRSFVHVDVYFGDINLLNLDLMAISFQKFDFGCCCI